MNQQPEVSAELCEHCFDGWVPHWEVCPVCNGSGKKVARKVVVSDGLLKLCGLIVILAVCGLAVYLIWKGGL